MNYSSIGAQSPLPTGLDSSVENQLQQACKETIKRSSGAIHALVHFFQDQLTESSNSDWANNVAETLDKIRFQALDLIQAQYGLSYLNAEQKEKAELAITLGAEKAKNTLVSSPSSVTNLSRLINVSQPFFLEVGRCLEDGRLLVSGVSQRPIPAHPSEKPQNNPS